MTQPTKKTNGAKTGIAVVCPHTDVCSAPSMQQELMRSLDDMSQSLQMLIQRVEQVHSESLERARVYIECNDAILKALRRVEEQMKGEADAA